MAFSFRTGTNWCHDFPKLARESGFYFNNQKSRVRIDWNRISSIDIDRIIRERDLRIVDENVNNVIDYCLESEYDVKILDPNFVKLFRLSQLAAEYLLYCKQYLDQSVVILKEELKYKLEENVKLKEEVVQYQDTIKDLKEKLKEKSKSFEVKPESHGEVHKCPHCPKTFVSASFAHAHLLRRHSHLTSIVIGSPHEEYRSETEKLHNEIKTLKERLNQTERVIRNEVNANEKSTFLDEDNSKDEQYRKYQEEINNLKSMLFTEIRNIKKKDSNISQQDHDANQESIKVSMNQQEIEIQRLKNQLHDHLKSNSNEFQTKLCQQEDYWKAKLEQMEQEHRKDIENLFSQLKLTQESASKMKTEYEEKVSFLEKQSMDQSKLLHNQSEQLNSLKRGLIIDTGKKNTQVTNIESNQTSHLQRAESFINATLKNTGHKKPKVNELLQVPKNNLNYNKLSSIKKMEALKVREELPKETYLPRVRNQKRADKNNSHKSITRDGNKYSSLDESWKSESSYESETESETDADTEEESSESSATHTESTNDEIDSDLEDLPVQDKRIIERKSHATSFGSLKKEIKQEFEARLKEIGLDPEWSGVPEVTYKQKIESIEHQRNIAYKGFPKYEQIRNKILEELSRRLFGQQRFPKHFALEKKSFLNKTMKNVKSKALKAFHDFKVPKGYDTPISDSKNSPLPESHPRGHLSLQILPKKLNQQDILEIKRQTRLESPSKLNKDDLSPKQNSSRTNDEHIHQTVSETIQEYNKPRTKRSYQTIEDFMNDIEDESSKLETAGTKVTSTPLKIVKKQDPYTFTQESASQETKQESIWTLPKNSKSVLKSTSNHIGGMVKKKVLFDLEKETSPIKGISEGRSIGDFIAEIRGEKKEDENIKEEWNSRVSRIIEKSVLPVSKDKDNVTDNIKLQTSQSEKIAEISRKLQEKLEASRRKPAGSVETMFAAKISSQNNALEISSNYPTPTTIADSILDSPSSLSSYIEPRPRTNIAQIPKPAPRKQVYETKDLALNNDIEELLA